LQKAGNSRSSLSQFGHTLPLMCTTQSLNVAGGCVNRLVPADVRHVAHIAARRPAGLGAFAPARGASPLGLETTATLPPHGVPPQ